MGAGKTQGFSGVCMELCPGDCSEEVSGLGSVPLLCPVGGGVAVPILRGAAEFGFEKEGLGAVGLAEGAGAACAGKVAVVVHGKGIFIRRYLLYMD